MATLLAKAYTGKSKINSAKKASSGDRTWTAWSFFYFYRPHPKDEGRYSFQFVCQFTPQGDYPVPGRGGSTKCQVWTGGTPSQVWMRRGVPHPRPGPGGIPHLRSGQGSNPFQVWMGGGFPISGLDAKGDPIPGLDRGVPHPRSGC